MIEKRIYVCSPLSAPTRAETLKNMYHARSYEKIVSKRLKCRAIAPHGYMPEFIDEYNYFERILALNFGRSFLSICDGLVICGNRITDGMREEIKVARQKGIPIYRLRIRTKPPMVKVLVRGWMHNE